MSLHGTQLAAAALDAAASLTEKNTESALAEAMIAVVRLHSDAGRVSLLALAGKMGDGGSGATIQGPALAQNFLDPHAAPRRVDEDPQLAECVRTSRTLGGTGPGGGKRLVIPVPGLRDVIQLLVIEGLRELRLPEPLLERLVRVYANQLFHLTYKEHDPLTGLYNRQAFTDRIKQASIHAGEVRRRARDAREHRLSLALIDIDHFKEVNDRYGHVYGDEVLLLFARLMSRSFRADDLLFRYGGEEFIAILPEVRSPTAVMVLERFRTAVETFDFPRVGRKTVSIGVTEVEPTDVTQDIVGRADQALYFAKGHGRNQVCSYEALLASGKVAPSKIEVGDIELF